MLIEPVVLGFEGRYVAFIMIVTNGMDAFATSSSFAFTPLPTHSPVLPGWEWVEDPFSRGVDDCDFASANDGWLASGSEAVHWDGTTWNMAPWSPTFVPHNNNSFGMDSVRELSPTDVWFSSWGGYLSHWDGKTLTSYFQADYSHLRSLSLWNDTVGFVFVDNSLVYNSPYDPNYAYLMKWDGRAWNKVPFRGERVSAILMVSL